MKIKVRLEINLWITLVVVALMLLSFAWTYLSFQRVDANKSLVAQLRQIAFDRILLRDEYLLYREDRARSQWHARSEQLKGLLESAGKRFTSRGDKAILQEAQDNFQATYVLFSTLMKSHELEEREAGKYLVFDDAESQRIGQVFLKASALNDSIARLYESSEKSAIRARNTGFMLLIVFILAGGSAIFVNSVMISRIMTKRIDALADGVAIIGDGKLDHRIDASGDDELSDLARKSNEMAAKLKESYLFVDNLQEEVAERKRTAESLRESELRLRLAQDAAKAGTWEWDLRTNENIWSEEVWGLFGIDSHSINPSYEAWRQTIHPDDRILVEQVVQGAAAQNIELNTEWRVLTPDGSVRWLMSRGMPIRDEDGRAIRYLGIVMDITERKRAELEIQNSRNFLDSIIEQSPGPMWISDEKGMMVRINKACCDMLRITPEEVVGRYNLLEDHIVESQGMMPLVRSVFNEGKTVNFDLTYDTSDLKTLPLERRAYVILNVTIYPIRDNTGKITNAVIQHINITERKQAQEKVRKAADEWQATFDSITDPIMILDRDFRIIQANSATLTFFSLPRDQIMGSHCYSLMHGSEEPLEGCPLTRMIRTREHEQAEIFSEERGLWLLVSVDPILDENGEISRVVHIISDITERKQSDELLRQSEEKYRILVENANEAIIVIQDTIIKFCNPKSTELLGYSQEEILYKSFIQFIHPEDMDMVVDRHLRRLSGEVFPSVYSFKVIDKEKTIKWIEVNSVLISWEGMPATLIFISDITERKQAEAELRNQMDFLETLIDTIPTPVFYKDIKGVYLGCNSAFEAFMGKSRDRVVGKTVYDLAPPDLADQYHAADMNLFDNPGVQVYEASVIHADGSVHDVIFNKAPFTGYDGSTAGLVGVMLDITDRKRADELILRQGKVLDQSLDGIAIADLAGTIQYVNASWAAMHGYTVDELKGVNLDALSSPEDAKGHQRSHLELIRQGIDHFRDIQHRRKDGTVFPILLSLFTLKDAQGEPTNIVAFTRDITEEQRVETLLRQAQKMEAVGQLAGGIAHDFNNMLSPILGYADLLLQDMKPGDPHYQEIVQIKQSGERAKDLTWQLLAFSRKQIMEMKNVDLSDVITDMQKILRRTIREDIAIRVIPSPKPTWIRADPGKIGQILMNLAVNAQDAMPNGGTITIETAEAVLDEAYAETHLDIVPGSYAMLSFSDTGTGMEQPTLEHIFEPFFTTKDPGKGTGLGLATIYGIVKQHNGYIVVYSELDVGTTFKVYLPRIQGLDERTGVETEQAPEIRRGTETVLVVEDEDSVRELVCRILSKHGYAVISAGSPKESLQVIAQHQGAIHLLLTDVIMPGMNGKQLYDHIAASNPAMKVIFISGYTYDVIAQHGMLIQGTHLISKPFTIRELMEKVRSVLDS